MKKTIEKKSKSKRTDEQKQVKARAKRVSKKQNAKTVSTALSTANKSVSVREVIIIEADKNNVLFSTNFNQHQCKLTFKSYVEILLKSTSDKKQSKHNYNVNVLRVLHADSRSKKLKQCTNTHYDTYYKAIKLLIDKILNKQQLQAYSKKLAIFQKRN